MVIALAFFYLAEVLSKFVIEEDKSSVRGGQV
jgi:hypothetical protein